MLCSEWSLVKSNGATATVQPLRCRCWTCEECAPIRKRQLMAQAHSGHPNTFLTLTVNPRRGRDHHDRARSLAHAWRKLRQRAMRKYNLDALPFLAVFEKTKAGEPHLHILMRSQWLSQKWLSAQMRELIGAPIVDIRRVHGASKVADYVSKYIGKDPKRFVGTKRYWSSRDYEPKVPFDEEDDGSPKTWTMLMRRTAGVTVSNMTADGFAIIDEQDGVTTLAYPALRSHWQVNPPDPPPVGRLSWSAFDLV